MDRKYLRKNIKTAAFKILMIPLLVLLSFFAVRAGITLGNLVYDMDSEIIGNIDTENFKTVMNASLPIINSVYNSGNISVSVSGEIRSIVKAVFNFDLDSPLTILNVQSPLFMSYFNKEYKEKLALSDQPPSPFPEPAQDKTIPKGGVPEDATDPGDASEPGGTSGPGDTSGPQDADQAPDTKTDPGQEDKEPISSITLEEKEDEEKDKSDILKNDKIEIHNYTSFKINLDQLLKEPFQIKFSKKGPKVLIYHTHTSESYVLNGKDLGKKGIAAYNEDPRYNVVRVGEELSRNLKKYGIDVLHNGTVHDSNFPAAYGASLKTIQKYAKSYPSIKIMFDMHRDGLGNGQKLRAVTKVKGKNAAQIMFVVGTNGNGLPHPEWRENLKFAIQLQQVLNERYPGLAKPIWISKNRYNQQITNNSLIIEIGGDGNLLGECLESTKYLAEAVNAVIKKK